MKGRVAIRVTPGARAIPLSFPGALEQVDAVAPATREVREACLMVGGCTARVPVKKAHGGRTVLWTFDLRRVFANLDHLPAALLNSATLVLDAPVDECYGFGTFWDAAATAAGRSRPTILELRQQELLSCKLLDAQTLATPRPLAPTVCKLVSVETGAILHPSKIEVCLDDEVVDVLLPADWIGPGASTFIFSRGRRLEGRRGSQLRLRFPGLAFARGTTASLYVETLQTLDVRGGEVFNK